MSSHSGGGPDFSFSYSLTQASRAETTHFYCSFTLLFTDLHLLTQKSPIDNSTEGGDQHLKDFFPFFFVFCFWVCVAKSWGRGRLPIGCLVTL